MKYFVPMDWLQDDEGEEDVPPHYKRFGENLEALLKEHAQDQRKTYVSMMMEARACGLMDAIAFFCLADGTADDRIRGIIEKFEVDPNDVAAYIQYIVNLPDEEDDD